MPHQRTSVKSLRQNKQRRLHNLKIKQELKKILKKFSKSVTTKDKNEAKTLLSQVFSKLDKAAKKGIIKKNTASRKKSRLHKILSKAAPSKK